MTSWPDTVEEFGGLNVLVNNAAEQHVREDLRDIDLAQMEATFRTNVLVDRASRTSAPLLRVPRLPGRVLQHPGRCSIPTAANLSVVDPLTSGKTAPPGTRPGTVQLSEILPGGDALVYFSMGVGCDGCFVQIPEIADELEDRGITLVPMAIGGAGRDDGRLRGHGLPRWPCSLR